MDEFGLRESLNSEWILRKYGEAKRKVGNDAY